MTNEVLTGHLLDETTELSVSDLCIACAKDTAWVSALVDEGVLEPIDPNATSWRFSAICLDRAYVAMRIERDFGVNVAGLALVIDLLEELETLRARMMRLGEESAD